MGHQPRHRLELVRIAGSWAPPQTCWIRICTVASSPAGSHARYSLTSKGAGLIQRSNCLFTVNHVSFLIHCSASLYSDSDGKESTCSAGEGGLTPGSGRSPGEGNGNPGRSPGEGNGNPLQYSCLENSMDRGAWWATVHGVAKSLTP